MLVWANAVLDFRTMNSRKASPQVHSEFLSQSSGFTLVEVMIVMVILVAVLAIGAPTLFSSSTAMRGTIRELAVRTREIRNVGRLYGSTMRLVIDMNDEKGHSYWIESAPGNVTLMSQEQLKEMESMTSSQRDDEAPKKEFEMDSRVMRKPQTLPRGLYFDDVEYATRDAVASGPAFIHFFPQGIAEHVAIHLSNRKNLNWTVTINPLTGRADVYERRVSLKELESK